MWSVGGGVAGRGQRFPPGALTNAYLSHCERRRDPRWRKCAISGSPAPFTYRCRPEGGPTPQIGQTGRSYRECARKLLLSGGGAGTNVSPDALTMTSAYLLACQCDYSTEIRNKHGFLLRSCAGRNSSSFGFKGEGGHSGWPPFIIFHSKYWVNVLFYTLKLNINSVPLSPPPPNSHTKNNKRGLTYFWRQFINYLASY